MPMLRTLPIGIARNIGDINQQLRQHLEGHQEFKARVAKYQLFKALFVSYEEIGAPLNAFLDHATGLRRLSLPMHDYGDISTVLHELSDEET